MLGGWWSREGGIAGRRDGEREDRERERGKQGVRAGEFQGELRLGNFLLTLVELGCRVLNYYKMMSYTLDLLD